MNEARLAQLQTALDRLIELSRTLEGALIRSDFGAIEALAREIHGVLDTLPDAEPPEAADPERPLEAGPLPADESGMEAQQLAERIAELRAIEERNARLILEAMRLRERWSELLANMSAPTYGPKGRAAAPRAVLRRDA